MIPKIVHYIWLGHSPIPMKFINYNKQFLDGFEIKIWRDNDFDLSRTAYLTETYLLGIYMYTTDSLRWDILDKYGGIYLDVDIKLERQISEEMFNLPYWLFQDSNYDNRVNTGCIASEPNSIVSRTFKDYYDNIKFINNRKYKCLNDTDRSEDILKLLNTDFDCDSINKFKQLINEKKVPIFNRTYLEKYDSSKEYSFYSHLHGEIKESYDLYKKLDYSKYNKV